MTETERKPARREERLEARVTRETKALCQKAARMQGRTLTDFVVHTVVEEARRTINENDFLQLTIKDRVAFVDALINPPAPNAKLRRAMAEHSSTVKR